MKRKGIAVLNSLSKGVLHVCAQAVVLFTGLLGPQINVVRAEPDNNPPAIRFVNPNDPRVEFGRADEPPPPNWTQLGLLADVLQAVVAAEGVPYSVNGTEADVYNLHIGTPVPFGAGAVAPLTVALAGSETYQGSFGVSVDYVAGTIRLEWSMIHGTVMHTWSPTISVTADGRLHLWGPLRILIQAQGFVDPGGWIPVQTLNGGYYYDPTDDGGDSAGQELDPASDAGFEEESGKMVEKVCPQDACAPLLAIAAIGLIIIIGILCYVFACDTWFASSDIGHPDEEWFPERMPNGFSLTPMARGVPC